MRALGVGQAAYVHQGGVTYVQVKRLVAAPAALARVPVAAAGPPGGRPGGVRGRPGPSEAYGIVRREGLAGRRGLRGGGTETGGAGGAAGQAGTGDTIPLPAVGPARAGRPLADVGTFLDEAFGREAP